MPPERGCVGTGASCSATADDALVGRVCRAIEERDEGQPTPSYVQSRGGVSRE
jgi:hypothetical protein